LMRFPIDAVFMDKQREVVKVTMVKPWRVALSNGHSMLELPAGRAALALWRPAIAFPLNN